MISKDFFIKKMNINFEEYRKIFIRLSQKKHFKFGFPFILFIVGASFGMKYITNLRYKYRSVVTFRDEAKKKGLNVKSPEEVGTLESHYEKMKELDIDNWENIRIPRSWEEEEEEK